MVQSAAQGKKRGLTALAFLLPVFGLLVVRLICSLCFNGTYSMLYSDCYHQYYPFFLEFRRALRSGEPLLYNWTVGMGMDYLGLVSYYLASPLNLFSALLPESWMLAYFSALMPIKLGLAGLFFCIFLQKTFHKKDFSTVIFGCMYALCAWALGYQWNIMWLDTFALLPLVVLGAISLLREKKFVLYTVTLFFSVATNYYIGFFTCIFVLLLFICYQICRWESFKKFLGDLMRFAVFSLLAIGMTAFLELPALAALQTTQSSVNRFPTAFRMNIASTQSWYGLFDAMRKVAGNGNLLVTPTFKDGLPNIYCGLAANVLGFLFFMCKPIKLRDKFCAGFMLLFLNVSFIIRQLDYIWHGFHFTNQIPYRFSFLYSFVLLYMAYRAWMLRRNFKLWQILLSGALAVGLVFCSKGMDLCWNIFSGRTAMYSWSSSANIMANLRTICDAFAMPLTCIVFIALYTVILCYVQKRLPVPSVGSHQARRRWLRNMDYRRRVTSGIFLSIVILELAVNLTGFGARFSGSDMDFYPRGKEDSKAVLDYMHQREENTLFYRAEMAHSQTFNDAALNDYNGITTFTSSANVRVTEFMRNLGYASKNTYNRYCYEESTPVANLFLNLKYMVERDGVVKDNPYFDARYTSGKVTLLENNAYLPLGFLAEPQLINLVFDADEDYFGFQNGLLKTASGIEGDVWQPLDASTLTIQGSKVDLKAFAETGYCHYDANDTSSTITYIYTADKEGLMCFMLDQSKRNKFSVYVNGNDKPIYSETYSLPQMLSVCNVQPGDVVEIRFTCTNGESGNINITAAVLNEELFRRAYEVLAASTLELTNFSTTLIEGNVNCNRDGVLYTSIPQDGNWTAYVDGAPAQVVLIGDAMIGLILSKGTHTIRFEYHNKAFSLGWKISLGCAGIFLVLALIDYRHLFKRRKGKYEQT